MHGVYTPMLNVGYAVLLKVQLPVVRELYCLGLSPDRGHFGILIIDVSGSSCNPCVTFMEKCCVTTRLHSENSIIKRRK